MKMVTAVLHADSWPGVFDALKVIDVDGLTLTELASPPPATLDLRVERDLRVEIVTDDEHATEVAETILEADPSADHEGLQLWISAVDGFVPVRTEDPIF